MMYGILNGQESLVGRMTISGRGEPGVGIETIVQTETSTASGGRNTWTVTLTDGRTSSFYVRNGAKGDTGVSITNVALKSSSGLVDTYEITFSDGNTTTFNVTNGNGISSIAKTGTSGNVDTYTINYTNGTTSTFTVTNSNVSSVNGQTGDVVLTANEITYDETAAQTSGSIGKEVTDLKSAISTKAEIDGSYENMTVGNAEQLVSTVFVEDNEPYQFRTAGGSANIGDREYDEIVGGTVAWNQLFPIGNNISRTQNNVTIVDNRDGSYTISTTSDGASANTYASLSQIYNINVVSGHKYLIRSLPSPVQPNTYSSYITGTPLNGPLRDTGSGAIGMAISSGVCSFVPIYIYSGTVITTPVTIRPVLFDLTTMFGSTIADYIYSLEQANAGAGVAWFKKLFPKDYYEYNAGELLSVNAASHDMVGFNLFDESDDGELVGNNYRFWDMPIGKTNQLYMTLEDTGASVDMTGISFGFAQEITSGSIAEYRWVLNSGTIQNNHSNISIRGVLCGALLMYPRSEETLAKLRQKYKICVNISWDGKRDGEYEPYVKHSYPIDESLELRGIPKLDANNQLYYDGDTYESDGTVTRRYGIVDLGTLGTWSEYAGYPGLFYLNVIPNGAKIPASNTVRPSIVANGYIAGISRDIGTSGHTQGEVALAANRIYVANDSYAGNVQGFRTAISGVYLVYELAEPTTESADPYQNPQIVDDFGTEEYVDYAYSQNLRDVAIPVGHETKYQPNLRAKLEMAPESPNGDGDYLVRHANGENSYVAFVKELPTFPSENGNYLLKVTVSGSTKTLSWEAQT